MGNRPDRGSVSENMRSAAAVLFYLGIQTCLHAASPALTIYNQDFAVIRDLIPLTPKAGLNSVEYDGMTANAEPESVVLRDPAGKFGWQITEQNYRKDAASLERLLELYQGKTIQFQTQDGKILSGRILRGPSRAAANPPTPYNMPPVDRAQAMIEAEGQVRFGLPGTPLFPTSVSQILLKPVMQWTIRSDRNVQLDAELGYISGGLTWKADYNVVSTEGRMQVKPCERPGSPISPA